MYKKLVLLLAYVCVLMFAGAASAAPELVFHTTLNDAASVTATGGAVTGGGIFVPTTFPAGSIAKFQSTGNSTVNWGTTDTDTIFAGWDKTKGITVDLYFSGIGDAVGDVGMWSVGKRAGGDNFLILVARDDEFRFNIRDEGRAGDIGGGTNTILTTGVDLNPATTYRLTVRQHVSLGNGGDLEIFLESISDGGAQYPPTDIPIRTLDLPAGNFDFPSEDGGSGEVLGMRVGDKYPHFGGSGFELRNGDAIDNVRVFNGVYTPAELDIPYASNPRPAHDAINVPPDVVLSWDAPDPNLLNELPARYNVYFGTEPNELSPNFNFVSEKQLENFHDPNGAGLLDVITDYYWRIDVVDPNQGGAIEYTGDLWHFTTVPPKATEPFPLDKATGVAQNVVLSWNSGYGADEHDVYIGTDEALVTSGDPSVFKRRQTETTYDPDLDWETEYFWRIDEVFDDVVGDPGYVWSFTTDSPECEYELGGDANGDCIVDLRDVAIMAANWLECNLVNGDCP